MNQILGAAIFVEAPYENTRAPRIYPIRQIDNSMSDVIKFAQGLSQERYASAARQVQATVCLLVKLVSRIRPTVDRYKGTNVLQQTCLRLCLLDVLA